MKSLLSAAATLRSHTALKQFAGRIPSPNVAFRMPAVSLPKVALPKLGLRRPTLYRAAAVATVGVGLLGTGVASAMFVDYLAERAVERSAQDRAGSIAPLTETAASKAVPEKDPAGTPDLPAPAASEAAKAAPAAPAPQAPETIVEPAGSPATVIASAKANAGAAPEMATAGDASLAAKSAANDDEFADRTFTAAISRPARTVQPAIPTEATAAQPTASEQPVSLDARAEAPQPTPQQVALNASEDETAGTGVLDAQADQPAAEATPVEEEAATPVEEEVETAAAEPTRTAKVNDHVNLRAGPKGKVLTVVPASEEVQIVKCDGWCEVVYDGTRGFIYKDFIE